MYAQPRLKEKVKAIVPIEESRREGKKGRGKRGGREGRKGREEGGKRGGREGGREEIFHGEES